MDDSIHMEAQRLNTALSEPLRALGLAEDTTPDAPLCRWRREDLIVDVMPVDEYVLGFSG